MKLRLQSLFSLCCFALLISMLIGCRQKEAFTYAVSSESREDVITVSPSEEARCQEVPPSPLTPSIESEAPESQKPLPAPSSPPASSPPSTSEELPSEQEDTSCPTVPSSPIEIPERPPQTSSSPSEEESDASSSIHPYEREVVSLVNEIRRSYGLKELTLNEELSAVAREKSDDMRRNGYFDHVSPTYGSPFDMMKSFGISYRAAGENIAMGYPTPAAVVEGWMNSEGHRANILNSSFSEIGVGYHADGHYWTQMFIG